MADTSSSSNVNKDILIKQLGLRQFSNTSIFLKNNIFVLSPSVQNTHKWFDLRKINIGRYQEKQYKGYLLIRYFDKFLITELDNFIKRMIPTDKYVETKSIGVHWKFNVAEFGEEFKIINRQDKSLVYPLKQATVEDIISILKI